MIRMRKLFQFVLITAAAAAACCLPAFAQKAYSVSESEPGFQFPEEAESFVEAGMKAIAYVKGDLNGDDLPDYIIVLEKPLEDSSPDTNERTTLIIVRDGDGKLRLAARNDRVVFCGGCGGGMGDPFDNVTVERGAFSITNRGGNRERWIQSFDFKYSRRDKTWQLIRVEEMNYDSVNLKTISSKKYTPPRHFGKINFADFDPDNFKKKRSNRKRNGRSGKTQKRLHEYAVTDDLDFFNFK